MADLLEVPVAPLAVIADKAHGSRAIRQLIADDGALAVIPSKCNAREPIPHNVALYKMRNIVERFFYTMKDMRRLVTRFEKLSRNFLAMVHIIGEGATELIHIGQAVMHFGDKADILSSLASRQISASCRRRSRNFLSASESMVGRFG